MIRKLLTGLAVLALGAAVGGAPASAGHDPWKNYHKYQQKQHKAWVKYQRKQAHEWHKYDRRQARYYGRMYPW